MKYFFILTNLILSFGSFLPIFVFITAFFRLIQSYPVGVRFGITLNVAFVLFLCAYTLSIFPYLFFGLMVPYLHLGFMVFKFISYEK